MTHITQLKNTNSHIQYIMLVSSVYDEYAIVATRNVLKMIKFIEGCL